MDTDSRLRVARGIAGSEKEASIQVFQTLKHRGHPEVPPLTVSDGCDGIAEAMIEVYGEVPEYTGRGRPPTLKKPGADWEYIQAIKERDEHGKVRGVKILCVFGNRAENASTAYIERSNLTSRMFNARQVRKTLAFSKDVEMNRAAAIWEDSYYNLIRVHKSLRQPCSNVPGRRWQPRTPAMAAGLTDHIWTVEELLTTLPLPKISNTS